MSFLQSLEWAEIEARAGRRTARLEFGGEAVWWYERPLKFGFRYWYAPRILVNHETNFFSSLFDSSLCRAALFLEIEPEVSLSFADQPIKVARAKSKQPEKTLIVDLSPEPEAMLNRMHPKTRYNIGLAGRHAVRVSSRAGADAVREFYELIKETAARDKFRPHPEAHYLHLLQSNSHNFSNELFFAHCGAEIAAAAMVNFYQGAATYLHGGSNYSLRDKMASHLLHWEIMLEAKRRGFALYDLWGADAARWPGMTRFKRGFGGAEVAYPGAFDIVLRPGWYGAYVLARAIA